MSDRRRVAIVGAGSAGTSAALRLHQLFDGDVDLTVFERADHVGGRAWHLDFAGARIEIGGTVLHSTGQHTMAMMELTGSTSGDYGGSLDGDQETFAFWNDKGFAIHTKSSLASLAWGIIRHVGLLSALRVTSDAKAMAARWSGIYELQAAGRTFATEEMLRAVGLFDTSTVSLADHLRTRRVNRRMSDDVVEAIVHNMYNQGAELNAFAGEVGLAGAGLAGGYLFSVDGGNRTLLAKVLDVIGTDVRLNTEVTSISGQGDRWLVGTDAGTEAFDAVVLAAPLALADLDLSHSGSPLDYPVHPYQQVHVTLVVGEPSPAYFGVDPTRRFPSQVFVADSAGAPFKSLGITGFSPTHQQRIYKIFSAEVELSDEVLGQIFASIAEVRRWVWRVAGSGGAPIRSAPPGWLTSRSSSHRACSTAVRSKLRPEPSRSRRWGATTPPAWPCSTCASASPSAGLRTPPATRGRIRAARTRSARPAPSGPRSCRWPASASRGRPRPACSGR